MKGSRFLRCFSFGAFYVFATLVALTMFLYMDRYPYYRVVFFFAVAVGIYWIRRIILYYIKGPIKEKCIHPKENQKTEDEKMINSTSEYEEADLIKELWKKTGELIQKIIEAVSSWTFFLFFFSFIISCWLESKNHEIAEYCFAISSTLLTIWLIEIVYSRRMDDVNLQKMNLLLMQIFQRKTWLKDMDDEWREKVVNACFKASFGNELGDMYTMKTFGNQRHINSYRKNFRYDVSIQRRINQSELFLVQKLQYKKMVKVGKDITSIVSTFEFKQDPFLLEGKDLVFFREELRSFNLIFLIKNAVVIAEKFESENAESRNELYLKKVVESLVNEEVEQDRRASIMNFWNTKQDVIITLYNRRKGGDLRDIIPIVLLEYQLNYLNPETGQKEQSEPLPVNVEYIKKGNEVRGVRFKSELVNSGFKWSKENDGYYSIYCSMECGYPIGGQHSFYWKFEEPIIAPQYQMQFPDAANMENVQVVQYFSDNKQHVNKSNTLRSVWFTSTELFLPESGIYIHWPKEMEVDLLK